MKWLDKLIPSVIKGLVGKILSGLTGPVGWLARLILNAVLKRLWAWLKVQYRRAEVKKEAKESVEPLKKAKTAEEIDAATDDALNGL